MKATGKTTVTHTTTITGELSAADIETLIRQRIHVPTGGTVRIYVDVPGGADWSSTELDAREHPVRFEITFGGETETDLERLLAPPAPEERNRTEDRGYGPEAVITAPPGERPRCSIAGCPHESLAGGLCPSHMSEAHRRRHSTLPSR